MKHLLLIFLALISATCAVAQKINGVVTTTSGEKLWGANIVLYSGTQKLMIYQTDKNGAFVIAMNEYQDYKNCTLTINYLGFEPRTIIVNELKTDKDLGEIVLQAGTKQLKDVFVTGDNQIQKGDCTLYIPTLKQKHSSNNGIELINKLMLPGVQVDMLNKTINLFSAQEVLLYINDRKVNTTDVMALRPSEVIRVEYIDNPGLEFGFDQSIGAVIKFITKKLDNGVALGFETLNALTTGNNKEFIYGKYIKGNSEFGIQAQLDFADENKLSQDDLSHFTLSDNSYYDINHEGIDSRHKESDIRVNLYYNYNIHQKHLLRVIFHQNFTSPSNNELKQKLSETGNETQYSNRLSNETQQNSIIGVFYKNEISKKENIKLRINYNWITSNYKYLYQAFNDEAMNNAISAYGYNTDGKSYILSADALYTKTFKNTVFSSGAVDMFRKVDNTYYKTNIAKNIMSRNFLYMHAEARTKLNDWYLAYGVGSRYNILTQDNISFKKIVFLPRVTIAYTFNKWALKYFLTSGFNVSKLADQSNIKIQQNALEYSKGNPNLATQDIYFIHNFQTNYKNKRTSLQNLASYVKYNNFIGKVTTRETTDEGDLFWHTYENFKYQSQFSNRLSLQVKAIKDVLSLNFGVNYRYLECIGENDQHYLSTFQYVAGFDLLLGKWNFGGNYNSSNQSLMGEVLIKESPYNSIYATYKIGNFKIGINGMYLFIPNGLHNTKVINSRYMEKKITLNRKSTSNMILVSMSWNMQWGKKLKTAPSNETKTEDIDTGILRI